MTSTEQEWLGNGPQPGIGVFSRPAEPYLALRALAGYRPEFGTAGAISLDQIATPEQIRAISEAGLIRGMKQAMKPFRRPNVEPKQGWDFPRAGIRRRPDGRYQLRIWLDPMMTPDPVQGGACETIAEAYDLGAMICHYARQNAA